MRHIFKPLSSGLFLFATTVIATGAEKAPIAGGIDAAQNIDLSTYQTLLIVGALASCLACIYMVFFFGRRLQASAFGRDSLVVNARQEQLRNLMRRVDDLAKKGLLDKQDLPPDGFGPPQQLWKPGDYVSYRDRLSDSAAPSNETADEKKARSELLASCQAWENRERDRYKALSDAAEMEAGRLAEAEIPKSMDISLLGGGWSFLLEFSTVMVIIFTLMVLGIAGVVTGRDITTILAAIAGYVLGKATAQKEQDKPKGEGGIANNAPASQQGTKQ